MMKIKTEDKTFYLPLRTGVNVLIDNDNSKEIVLNLTNYFGNKKKNMCSIYDEENNAILPKEYDFIYVSSKENIENNIHFKEKSVLNCFVKKYISNNQECFNSLDRIRNDIKELVSDSGIFRLKRIMNNYMNTNIDIEINEFNLSSILEMLRIVDDEMDIGTKYAFLYNVLLYERNNVCRIIYIDFDLTDDLKKWLEFISKEEIVIVNSASLERIDSLGLCSAFISNACLNTEKIELMKKEFSRLIYVFNPFFQKNILFQKEENIKFLKNFTDCNTNFLIDFK